MGKIGYLVGEKVMRKSMKQRKMVDSDRGMDFAPYVSGFCHIHGKTPRGILRVNSKGNVQMRKPSSEGASGLRPDPDNLPTDHK